MINTDIDMSNTVIDINNIDIDMINIDIDMKITSKIVGFIYSRQTWGLIRDGEC